MKMKAVNTKSTDADEKMLVESVHALAEMDAGASIPAPPAVHWQNLLVRTNRRIDEVTSGKALAISWAARVAIPGVVAILSFIVGLHYYGPEQPAQKSSLTSFVLSLPERSVDSLLLDPSSLNSSLSLADLESELPDPPKEVVAEYFIENGKATDVVETLTDQQVEDVLSVLGSTTN